MKESKKEASKIFASLFDEEYDEKPQKADDIYFIDTSVLINSPECIEKLIAKNKHVAILGTVADELEKIKDDHRNYERSKNARTALNIIKKHLDDVYLVNEEDDFYFCEANKKDMTNDEKIIEFVKRNFSCNAIVVTDDIGMTIRAKKRNIKFILAGNIFHDPLYKGRSIYKTESVSDFFENGKISVSLKPLINEYMLLEDDSGNSALARFDGSFAVPLIFSESKPMKIKARNTGQRFAIESLMSDSRPLSIIYGPAGTGKTLLALACGLEKCRKHIYEKIILCRPYVTSDEDIGALPGDEYEKVTPLHKSAADNLKTIAEISGSKSASLNSDFIDIEAFSFIRGRSIKNSFIIVDEAQNMSVMQIKTLVTRAGENTKIVLLGDVTQIDNPKISRYNSGFVYAIEKMKKSRLCDVVAFEKSECTRSALAKEAIELMEEDDAY